MSVQNKKKKITVPEIVALKKRNEKIAMLTAYDALMAELIDTSGVDIILIGDSAGMVMQGKENTLSVTLDDMLFYTKSVRSSVKNALLVVDMPFLTYQVSTEKAVENAGKLLQAGAEAVKIEGGEHLAETVSAMVSIGIPVMGHLGLTPQSVHQFGGFKPQAQSSEAAESLLKNALILEKAGVFSLVLESIPALLAEKISTELNIPTIGIGAGAGCDGQVLVSHDMLGLFRKFKPKFVRRYAELGDMVENACKNYINDVKNNSFPSEDESY